MNEGRFWAKVNKSGECWIWTGAASKNGYGNVWVGNNKFDKPYRVAYRLTYGAIPAGLCVCHHCDNPRCVRPDHLFLGTQADNVNDMIQKGRWERPGTHRRIPPDRQPRGEAHGQAKLTQAQVEEIRKLRNTNRYTYNALAARFGVSRSTIINIVTGKTWRSD